jgi:hypothetical protein
VLADHYPVVAGARMTNTRHMCRPSTLLAVTEEAGKSNLAVLAGRLPDEAKFGGPEWSKDGASPNQPRTLVMPG